MPFSAVIELSALNGTDGFQVIGETAGSQSGTSVASAGDINGDGIEDWIVGAPRQGAGGAAYIVFGAGTPFSATFNLSQLNGSNGFQISGAATDDYAGIFVGRVGDINNDGFDDLSVGATGVSGNNAGAGYVLFGKNTSVSGNFASDISVSTLTGTTGFKVVGVGSQSHLGTAVATGDFNGDGIADMIVGAGQYGSNNYMGRAYVIFGRNGSPGATIDVTTLDGATGFAITNPFSYGGVGGILADTSGDLNGDGIDDIIITAGAAGDSFGAPGKVYVLYGKNTGTSGNFASSISISAITGVNGASFTDSATYGQLGYAVDFAGDVNGDGFDDLIIGGVGTYNAYVVFGKNGNFGLDFDLTTLNGSNGFKITGPAGSDVARHVSSAGDVNGDGFQDILLVDWAFDTNGNGVDSGSAWVVFGHSGAFGASLDVSTLDGTNGFRLDGESAGDKLIRAAAIGDVNHDGLDDIALSSYYNTAGGVEAGSTWIVFGRASNVNYTGTGGDDTASGGATDDSLSGGAGADILNGLDGADTLDGGSGKDELYGGNGVDTMSGGSEGDWLDGGAGADGMSGGTGDDTYIVDDAGDTTTEVGGEGNDVVHSTVNWTLGANIEVLILDGVGNLNGTGNTLANTIVGNAGNNILDGADGDDTIKGGAGNDTITGGNGADTLYGGDGTDNLDGQGGTDRLDGGIGDDTLVGGAGNDILDGGADNDNLSGGIGADQVNGGSGTDTLNGNDGNDILDGGTGADAMTGGLGDDIFYVDNTSDTTIEASGEGTDTVHATVNWTLAANTENLVQDGAGNIDGTGNSLGNGLTGNAGANTLDGAGGDDVLKGGNGADTLIGGTGADILVGGAGADTFVVRQESVRQSHLGGSLEIDTVNDLIVAQSDKLDLSAIDADSNTIGDQAFHLVGAFTSHAGEMTLSFAAGITTLQLDVDGDGVTDYRMKITGDVHLDSGGWVL